MASLTSDDGFDELYNTPKREQKPLVVPLAPKKTYAFQKRLFERTIEDQIGPFIVNGTDVLCGKSAIREIRESMTKSEWFDSMTQEQKDRVAEIAYFFLLEDLEIDGDHHIPVNKELIPMTFQLIVNELSARGDDNANDSLLRIGNLIDDGLDWLPEGGED
jgi:hypothetical protein